ncbi:MAG: hypothetical protein WC455_18935 [Dehalococcoidia bacterium]|jgi:hypothetical protein
MEICRREVEYRSGDTFRLYDLGDIHGGTVHCAEDKASRVFGSIVDDPFALWWDKGDSLDCITPGDPRFRYKIIAPWLVQDNIAKLSEDWYCNLVEKAVAARLPYADASRCLGKVKGNHEWEMQRHNIADIQSNICKRLDITNMGYSCFYHLAFKRVNSTEAHLFRFHVTHGSGNAQTSGGRTQKLRKIMNQTTALYTSVAHMHDVKVETTPALDSGQDLKLKGRNRIGVISGSFLRTYTQGEEAGYGELRNYDPTTLGYVMWEINPGEESITAKPKYV